MTLLILTQSGSYNQFDRMVFVQLAVTQMLCKSPDVVTSIFLEVLLPSEEAQTRNKVGVECSQEEFQLFT